MTTIVLEEELQKLAPLVKEYAQNDTIVTEHNVHQMKNMHIRPILTDMVRKLLLDGSKMYPAEHLAAFFTQVQQGKKGIILAEHYSNLDLPIIVHLMEQACKEGKAIADRLVAMAGMKLNEEDPRIAALIHAYERIVIYPSRSLASITDPEKLEEEEKRARAINMAAMKALKDVRDEGKVVLIFPAGTRYRPGKPETKKGVREIDSYIRTADIMILISINGNCLRIPDNPINMLGDLICRDKVVMEVSPVIDCNEFREKSKDRYPDVEDKKQVVADYIMEQLDIMHRRNEN